MNALSPIVDIWSVGPEDLDDFWFYAEELIDKALARGNPRLSKETILADLRDGRKFLFVAKVNMEIKGAAICSMTQYDAKLMFTVNLCGGSNMVQWVRKGFWFLEECAKSVGCQGIEVYGRRGWGRLLRLKERSTLYERFF